MSHPMEDDVAATRELKGSTMSDSGELNTYPAEAMRLACENGIRAERERVAALVRKFQENCRATSRHFAEGGHPNHASGVELVGDEITSLLDDIEGEGIGER